MGRGGRKSQNQKFRVKKIGNLGYKSGEMEPQRKLGTYLSSRWSWRSESSANRSPTVAPLFSRWSWTLFSWNSQWRGGCQGGGEEKRVWPAATTWWPMCFVVASDDVSGREASAEKWNRRERVQRERLGGWGAQTECVRDTEICTWSFFWYGPRAGPFWPADWPDGPAGLTGRTVWELAGWISWLGPCFFCRAAGPTVDPAHFAIPTSDSCIGASTPSQNPKAGSKVVYWILC